MPHIYTNVSMAPGSCLEYVYHLPHLTHSFGAESLLRYEYRVLNHSDHPIGNIDSKGEEEEDQPLDDFEWINYCFFF